MNSQTGKIDMDLKNHDLIKAFEAQLDQVPHDNKFKIEPLKRPPRYGVFLWWPDDDDSWIHPDDVELAKQLIPSNRVFRRDDLDDKYSRISYGGISLRVRPSLWLEVKYEGYEIGDHVEVKSRNGKQEPLIAQIKDIVWENHKRRTEYVLVQEGRILRKSMTSDNFHMVKSINGFMTSRQIQMADKLKG